MTRYEAEKRLHAAGVPKDMSGEYYILTILECLGLIKFTPHAKSEREKLIDEAQSLNYNLRMNGTLVYSNIIKMIDDLIVELKK